MPVETIQSHGVIAGGLLMAPTRIVCALAPRTFENLGEQPLGRINFSLFYLAISMKYAPIAEPLIEMLIGAGQGNTIGGEFGGNVLLGYKVENGTIAGRVKDTMVSGNIYSALKKGVVIGNKSEWVGGSLKTPPIYCPSLSVSTQS